LKIHQETIIKLIRDVIAEEVKLREGGVIVELTEPKSINCALGQKLIEEAIEVMGELDTNSVSREKLVEELADVQEVMTAIRVKHNITSQELMLVMNKKFTLKGGFSNQFLIHKGIK